MLQLSLFDSYDSLRVFIFIFVLVVKLNTLKYSVQIAIVDVFESTINLHSLEEIDLSASLA